MKKSISVFLILILIFTLSVPAFAAAKVQLSQQKLTVNGESITCEKYNIDGSNYFKLRDLAKLLSGTENQFEVGYKDGVVTITTGQPYTPDGSELKIGKDKSSTAVVSKQTIMIDGVKNSSLSAYNLGGNNFFKLRDLGNVIGFDVDFDSATNTAIVNTGNQEPKTFYVLDKETFYLGIDLCYTSSYTYNSRGKLTTCITKNADGNVTTSLYDSNENMISNTTVFGDSISKTTYEYDANNRLIKETTALNNESPTIYIYKYDSHGTLEKEVCGDYSCTYVNSYDSNGNLIKRTCDNLIWTYEYNSQNVLVKSTESSTESSVIYTTIYKYNSDGKIIEESCTDSKGAYPSDSHKYTYDSNGNMITSEYWHDKELSSKAVYTYKQITV